MGDQENQLRSYIDQVNILRKENEELRRRLGEAGKFEQQVNTYINQVNMLQRENDDLKRRLGDTASL